MVRLLMVDEKLGWLDNWLHCKVDIWGKWEYFLVNPSTTTSFNFPLYPPQSLLCIYFKYSY